MFSRALQATMLALLAGFTMANDALRVNPPVAAADLTTHGSDWLWAVFAVMVASALGVTAWAFSCPPGRRAFHWIGVAILFTASIAYFSMASDLGSTPINVEFVRYRGDLFSDRRFNPYTRSIWYVRYIDWVVTTPLLLLELLLATGMPLGGIFITIFFDLVMIIGGLVGALVSSSYKWGYFTGSCVAMLYVFYSLLIPGRANAKAISAQAHSAYFRSTSLLLLLWLLYPIAWGVSDGGNVIATDSEMVFYGVLDLLAKPVFLFLHLFALRNVEYESFQLQSGHYSAAASNAFNNAAAEKRPLGGNTPAAGNAAAGVGAPANTAGYPPATGATTGQHHTTGAGLGAHGAAGTHTQAGLMHPTGATATRPSDVTAV